ncbi:hypothetical protein [Nitrosophilus alvini]|uniref:hypothetical protein n=1 Tax=Nitrosophilus alvini TaxID=2714855 RepID=UPI001909AD95|nr:hypothetical protein [Nitrosophilus alvini]
MKLFFYAKTGHRVGLDRMRRVIALMREFEEFDPLLMVSDFRAASYAKELGVRRSVGIDDVRNMPNITERGDIVIFDSDEYNEVMHQEMIEYFSHFVRVSTDPTDSVKNGEIVISPYLEGENIINAILIDKTYFKKEDKEYEKVFFYGDDDYEKKLLKDAEAFADENFDLLEGFYFFMGYDKELKKYFNNIYEGEMYEEVLLKSKNFVTSSAQSALEALAANSNPVYIHRDDKENHYFTLLEELGIPVLKCFSKNEIVETVNVTKNYNIKKINDKSVTNAATELKKRLNL